MRPMNLLSRSASLAMAPTMLPGFTPCRWPTAMRKVSIATGAPPELARAILAFVAHEDVPVIGTQVGPRFGAVGALRHCHPEMKVRMIREAGYV